MEIASIQAGFDFRIKASHAHPKHLIVPSTKGRVNNFISAAAPQFQLSDIEMVNSEETSPYTSLKDLLHTSSPPSSIIMSPNNSACRKDSWREIPMKDPLLQHAAWAYLQPAMIRSTDSGVDRDGNALLDKLTEGCCGVFAWLNDVVVAMMKNFCFRKRISHTVVNHAQDDKSRR